MKPESVSPLKQVCSRLPSRLRALGRILRDILYGMSLYDWLRELQKERGALESMFILLVFGDLLGIPVMPPYYTLRLLPYAVPRIAGWRRQMLREKDLTALFDQEIG